MAGYWTFKLISEMHVYLTTMRFLANLTMDVEVMLY